MEICRRNRVLWTGPLSGVSSLRLGAVEVEEGGLVQCQLGTIGVRSGSFS